MTVDEIEDALNRIMGREMKLSHVELHESRAAFIDIVSQRVRENEAFAELVGRQLSLYCSPPDPRTFYLVCNEPGHLVRERLITWNIDHPKG